MVVDNPPPVGFSYCTAAGPSGASKAAPQRKHRRISSFQRPAHLAPPNAGGGTSCGAWNDSLVATTQHTFLANFIKQMPQYAKSDMYITGESCALRRGSALPPVLLCVVSLHQQGAALTLYPSPPPPSTPSPPRRRRLRADHCARHPQGPSRHQPQGLCRGRRLHGHGGPLRRRFWPLLERRVYARPRTGVQPVRAVMKKARRTDH